MPAKITRLYLIPSLIILAALALRILYYYFSLGRGKRYPELDDASNDFLLLALISYVIVNRIVTNAEKQQK
ncbi:hypothetical protein HYN48_02855 [Flavobacterium magnum]|uniref:Uncharacterized protein n=1 Tax=Flavobacterium magnum TaxID=2162713 RepID=A0A2S0RCV0_9FLAO|nr:hypothetical protein [Flavobacterium magnum]AWA29110.1 hypothetical protein HYN48_02855 [Flavobacterium magnum]